MAQATFSISFLNPINSKSSFTIDSDENNGDENAILLPLPMQQVRQYINSIPNTRLQGAINHALPAGTVAAEIA